MNFFLAMLAYLLLGVLIFAGIVVMAVKGSWALLLIGIAVFMGLFVRYGCATH
jgi:hypothetical protein